MEAIKVERGLVQGDKRRYEAYDYLIGVNRKFHYLQKVKLEEVKISIVFRNH